MTNLTRFDHDGLELVIDTETGEAFATESGYARMSGIQYNSIRKRVSRFTSDKLLVKKAEILTTKGLKIVTLINAETVFDWLWDDKPELARAMGKVGATVYLHQLAGFKVSSTAIQPQSPATPPQLTRSEIIASLVPSVPTIWKSRYSSDFWQNLERLTGYKQGNIQCAKFINSHIYDYFDEDVRERLEKVNPLVAGKRKNKQHQHFDGELLAALEQHIFTVLQLMQATNSINDFEGLMIGRFRGSYQLSLF
jgi:hypothetical protein